MLSAQAIRENEICVVLRSKIHFRDTRQSAKYIRTDNKNKQLGYNSLSESRKRSPEYNPEQKRKSYGNNTRYHR